jgi:hypothetical protein
LPAIINVCFVEILPPQVYSHFQILAILNHNFNTKLLKALSGSRGCKNWVYDCDFLKDKVEDTTVGTKIVPSTRLFSLFFASIVYVSVFDKEKHF